MNDKDVIRIQNTIIKLQEHVIYELLYDFVKTSDENLKYATNKLIWQQI